MKLPTLVRRNLLRRKLATSLTALSVALGVALLATIGALRDAAEQGFKRSATVCDLVVGAKGSSLQLVLNTLYQMGLSPGNVPYSLYQELDDRRGVLWAVPLAVGDAYRGSRIVGVTDTFFKEVTLGSQKNRMPLELAEGRFWSYGRKVRSRTVYSTIQRLLKKLEVDPG